MKLKKAIHHLPEEIIYIFLIAMVGIILIYIIWLLQNIRDKIDTLPTVIHDEITSTVRQEFIREENAGNVFVNQ